MSNARQETIDHIVKEMRGNAKHNHALVEVSKYLTEIADRIEAAYKRLAIPTPEQWTEIARQGAEIADLKRENDAMKRELELGNAAAMREALDKILWCLEWMSNNAENKIIKDHLAKPIELAKSALSTPPRNCDRPECATTNAAQDVWRKEDGGKTAYYEWLFAEAKGYEK